MKKLMSVTTLAILSLAVVGALVLLSGCVPPKPGAKQVVSSINCPECGSTAILMSDKGAEKMEHICLFCKEVWTRAAAYSGTGWVTFCEKCDKVLGACPKCLEKIKAAS